MPNHLNGESKMYLEEAAQICHDIWAHWIKHQFSVSQHHQSGKLTLFKHDVERWKRQTHTHYPDLSESEKELDREVARKFLGEHIEAEE